MGKFTDITAIVVVNLIFLTIVNCLNNYAIANQQEYQLLAQNQNVIRVYGHYFVTGHIYNQTTSFTVDSTGKYKRNYKTQDAHLRSTKYPNMYITIGKTSDSIFIRENATHLYLYSADIDKLMIYLLNEDKATLVKTTSISNADPFVLEAKFISRFELDRKRRILILGGRFLITGSVSNVLVFDLTDIENPRYKDILTKYNIAADPPNVDTKNEKCELKPSYYSENFVASMFKSDYHDYLFVMGLTFDPCAQKRSVIWRLNLGNMLESRPLITTKTVINEDNFTSFSVFNNSMIFGSAKELSTRLGIYELTDIMDPKFNSALQEVKTVKNINPPNQFNYIQEKSGSFLLFGDGNSSSLFLLDLKTQELTAIPSTKQYLGLDTNGTHVFAVTASQSEVQVFQVTKNSIPLEFPVRNNTLEPATIISTPTSNPNTNTNTNNNNNNVNHNLSDENSIMIVAIVVGLILAGGGASIIYVLVKKISSVEVALKYTSSTEIGSLRPPSIKIDESGELAPSEYSGKSPSLPQTVTVISDHTTTNATLANTHLPLSIPAFLELSGGDFKLVSRLANGGAGEVYLAEIVNPTIKSRHNCSEAVVKVIKPVSHIPEQDLLDAFLQEVSISVLFMANTNCAKIYGFTTNPGKMMVMKRYQMSLHEWIKNYDRNFAAIVNLSLDFIMGIKALHREKFAHNDIKPHNVLLDIDKNNCLFAVLTDFGLATTTKEEMEVKQFKVVSPRGLTYQYAAPEVIDRFLRKVKCNSTEEMMAGDIYAYGMSLYQMIVGHNPWPKKNDVEIREQVLNGNRPDLASVESRGNEWIPFSEIISKCWKHEFGERAKYSEVILILNKIMRDAAASK